MSKNHRNYWYKFRDDFYNEGHPGYYLLTVPNGFSYIIVYQKMCLMSLNTNGILINKIGNINHTITVEDIFRALYCTIPLTIINEAITTLINLKLIEITAQKYIKICNYTSLVGSESASPEALRKRKQRAKNKELQTAYCESFKNMAQLEYQSQRHLSKSELETMLIGT